MTVYVDEIKDWTNTSQRRGLRYTHWCHMFADTRQELHDFADQLGLLPRWFQDHPVRWHYDLTPGRRAQAVRMGAREVTFRDAAALLYLRRQGDAARLLTDDNVVEVHTWLGGCARFRHETVRGRQKLTGLTVSVAGRPTPALFGDWVVVSEDGDCAVCTIGNRDVSPERK